jgi:hypothetical protein
VLEVFSSAITGISPNPTYAGGGGGGAGNPMLLVVLVVQVVQECRWYNDSLRVLLALALQVEAAVAGGGSSSGWLKAAQES